MRVIQHCATYRCISWLSYRDGEFHLPFVAVQYCRSAVHGENDGLQQNLRVPYPNASVIALVAHGTTTITVHGGRTSSSMVTASKCYSGRSLTWTPAAATPSCIHHCNHRPSPISSATVLRLRGISRIQAAGEFSAGPSCTLPRHEGVLPLCTRGGAWHRGCVLRQAIHNAPSAAQIGSAAINLPACARRATHHARAIAIGKLPARGAIGTAVNVRARRGSAGDAFMHGARGEKLSSSPRAQRSWNRGQASVHIEPHRWFGPRGNGGPLRSRSGPLAGARGLAGTRTYVLTTATGTWRASRRFQLHGVSSAALEMDGDTTLCDLARTGAVAANLREARGTCTPAAR